MEQKSLSKAEYFEALQREYLIEEFRSRVYTRSKDKNYHQRVMSYKKSKVEAIASHNNLLSIFNSESKYKEIHSQLFDSKNRPIFEMTEEDLRNYFMYGTEFVYDGEVYNFVRSEGGEVILYDKKRDLEFSVAKENTARIW